MPSKGGDASTWALAQATSEINLGLELPGNSSAGAESTTSAIAAQLGIDKILLWQLVGLQGALLSSLGVEPLFLDWLVLGGISAQHQDRMRVEIDRAVLLRAAAFEPHPVQVRFADFAFEHSKEAVAIQFRCAPQDVVSCQESVSFVAGQGCEIIVNGIKQGASSRRKAGGPLPCKSRSRLSKLSLFERHCALSTKGNFGDTASGQNLTYFETKQRSRDYIQRKVELRRPGAPLEGWLQQTQRPAGLVPPINAGRPQPHQLTPGPAGAARSTEQSQQHATMDPQKAAQTGPIRTAPTAATQRKQPDTKRTTTRDKKTKGTTGEKDRKTRSRLACHECKATKQKCDGPSRIPCRRCELYNLECKFTTKNGVISAPTASTNSTSTANNMGNNPVVAQKLYEIAARLQSIESALHIQQGISPKSHEHAGSSHFSSHMAQSDDEDGSIADDMDHDDSTSTKGKSNNDSYNPMSEIHQSMTALGTATTPRGTVIDDYGAPDIIRRGILTAEECQELFDFFFSSLHPWVMMLSLDDDRNAMRVRSRSPLLFHTILVLSTSYSTPFPSQLHITLVTFVNNIFAPQILSPQPHELTTDFLRAVDLLNLYKMTQFATRRAEGMDVAEAMRASKVNGLASWMMQGILARTAERLDLASTVQKFSRAYSASSNGKSISPELVKDLRLYYWLLSNDVHGNVQSGRRCNMEGAVALTTTRLFSSLHLQPYDVRLAASVEMFEIARPILRSTSYERTRRIPKADLERYNVGMAAWEDFWVPVLIRELAVDPLALSVMCPFAYFITLVYNASAYVSYKRNHAYPSDNETADKGHPTSSVRRGTKDEDGGHKRDGPRELSQWEHETLSRSVQAAEGLIFTLSEESRVPGAWRKVQWEEAQRSDGYRKLTMDDTIVALSKWGMDAITCVAYIFPLVFLCKLVNDGLLTADLVLLHRPAAQPAWDYPQKLPRLLELGASFLEAVAINLEHPATSQAHVLRALLDAGIKGYQSSPQLPRHAATVMSPLPSVTTSIFPPPNPPALDSARLSQYAAENAQSAALRGNNNGMNPSSAMLGFQSPNAQHASTSPSQQLRSNLTQGRMPQSNLASTLSAALGQGGHHRSINPVMSSGGVSGLDNHNNVDNTVPTAGSSMFVSSGGTSTPTSILPGGGAVSAGGMDSALTSVLNGFDPFFADPVGGTNFWDWSATTSGGGGGNGGSGTDRTSPDQVDWSAGLQ
ncbi:hypothetical protein OIV83_004392 [Microbotryomycetes sp. JL201]|nr:hypothetical protein OIV83_004392 [Microbotryomycetes sp. JL201]